MTNQAPTLPPRREATPAAYAEQPPSDYRLPNREYYKWLANELILNERAFETFMRRCHVIAKAGFYGLKTQEAVAGVVLKGFSLGMDFMESLGKIKFIKGNPVLRGPAAVSHIHAVCPGARLRCITEPGQETIRAVWRMERDGWEPREFAFTWAQVEAAGLNTRNDVWDLYPDRCLKWQAASVGVQEMFGDVLDGMYLAEEIEQSPVIDTTGGTAKQKPAPALSQSAPSPADLDFVRSSIQFWGMKWEWVAQRVLGTVPKSAPSHEETQKILGFFDLISSHAETLAGGGKVPQLGDLNVKTYGTEFDRFRACVETMDGKERALVWQSGARGNKEQAAQEAAVAAVMISLDLPAPKSAPDDEPDPAVVEAHTARARDAIAAAKRGVSGLATDPGRVTDPDNEGSDERAAENAAAEERRKVLGMAPATGDGDGDGDAWTDQLAEEAATDTGDAAG